MAEEDTTTTPPIQKTIPKPESPTTAHPLDFNDETQETGVISASGASQQASTEAPPPPPKPPRPLSPRQQAENTLKEAFPTIDAAVVKAILVASGWNVERAFHALLGMTDPSVQEEAPPPKPPRPSTSTTQRQLEEDEMYARQLAAHYNSAPRRSQYPDRRDEYPYRQRGGGEYLEEEKEYSFFDDDLPVIRENIRKGFLDTQSKVNSWVQNLRKKFENEDEDDFQDNQGRRTPSRSRGSGELSRRSGDRERYDADPQLLSDDFSALELRDGEAPPSRPPRRPLANPDLYKSSSPSPDRRKVSFQEGPPTEIGSSRDTPEPAKALSTGGRSSKWQPLTTVEPSPIGDNDPFSLGDSDDEKDTKWKEHNTEEGPSKKDTTEAAGASESAGK
ncbi:hypothetical protein MAP00_000618 [Monascus purpureus]|nr:hypothetical protein MAP00_000618 [Monascus purpureus]